MDSGGSGTKIFDAVYVIHVNAYAERWESARKQLAAVGISDPVRWNAVDGKALTDEALARHQREGRLASDLGGFDASALRGEIACALSHADVLENILERNLGRTLVLEDDFAIAGEASDWPARVESAYDDLTDGWEVWFLFRCYDVRKRARRLSPRMVVPYSPLCATAYAVTAAGARKLLEAARPAGKAIDRIYAEDVVRARRIRAFAASPPLVIPGEHPSIINAENPDKKWVEGGVNRPPEYWPDHYREARGGFPLQRAAFAFALAAAAALAFFLALRR